MFSDSRYVSYWVSLELVSEKIARWVHFISQFALEIHFIPSEMNMADIASRLKKGSIREATVTSPFQNIEIRNAQGIRIKYADVFSADKRKEMNAYFNDKKSH